MQGSSSTLEIITPSYAADFELCKDLVASVRRFAAEGIRHRLIVPTKDFELFRPLSDDVVSVQRVDDVLPKFIRKIPTKNIWLNRSAPWPPLRGWIVQQMVKLIAAASSPADYALLVDSDVVFVRGFDADDYTQGHPLTLYRILEGVTPEMSRHLVWDRVAHELLGLPVDTSTCRSDYIGWPCLWRPDIVRSLMKRVADNARKNPLTAIGRNLHFSEMVLYGVYVHEIYAKNEVVEYTSDTKCVCYSDETTLDRARLDSLLGELRDEDVAIMISAKSGTDLETRRQGISRLVDNLHGA